MKRIVALAILLVVFVSSCSVLRTVLRYADWMLVREANKIFDLDDSQKSKLKAATSSELIWIKKSWVPDLIALAKNVDKRAADGFDEADHIWVEQEWIQLRVALIQHVIPHLAPIAVTITSKQLEHAKKAFRERGKKSEDLLKLSDEKLQVKRASKLEDGVEDWYGDLTDKQEDTLCRIFACDRKDLERMLLHNTSFQDALIALIAEERDPEKWSEKAILWAKKPESVLAEPVKSTWLAFRKEQPKKLAELDAIMTQKQRDHAREKLRGMIEDLVWFKEFNP